MVSLEFRACLYNLCLYQNYAWANQKIEMSRYRQNRRLINATLLWALSCMLLI